MTRDRLVGPEASGEDNEFNWGLRPKSLAEYVGQRESVERLKIAIDASKARGESLDHLLLHGPPGLGKCITADSWIATDEGIVQFRELLPADLTAGQSRPTPARVVGLNGVESATHVYSSGLTSTRRIRTRSGFEIEGTLQHPVLVATSDGPQWKALGQLNEHDWIAVSRGANVWGRATPATYRADAPSDRRAHSEKIVRRVHGELSRALHRAPSVAELRRAYCASRDIRDTPTPQRVAHRLYLPLSDGRTLAMKTPLPLVEPAEIVVPRTLLLDGDAAYLLGALVGDGHIEKKAAPVAVLPCDESEMQEEIRRISTRLFDAAPRLEVYGNKAARLRFSPNQTRMLMQWGLTLSNAAKKCVPRSVLQGPRDAVVGFLQGAFDADGHARRDGISYSTRSSLLARQIQLLLANIGIIAQRKSRVVTGEPFWTLFIGGSDAQAFVQEVGFRLTRKQNAFVPSEIAGWSRRDRVPFAGFALCELLRQTGPHPRRVHRAFEHAKRDDRILGYTQVEKLLSLLPHGTLQCTKLDILRQLCDSRFYWDRVSDVQESEAETFDFVVPATHSFVANGLYNHNTTLAYIIAEELEREISMTSGPALERPADIMPYLINAKAGDIIFIDEIHRLPRIVEEFMYSAMEDWVVNFSLDKGMYSKPLPFRLEKFTLVGATTRPAMLTRPLRDRFGLQQHLDFYNEDDLVTIVRRSAHILNTTIDAEGAREIARRSRGTPRIANRLLSRVRDFAQVRTEDGVITKPVADDALKLEGIDMLGLDRLDRAVLHVIKDTYNGGPVGIEALAATLNEETDTLVDVVEPYLLKIGFVARTPSGRRITRRAYEHLGEVPPRHAMGESGPATQPSLLEEAWESTPHLRDVNADKHESEVRARKAP